MIVCEHCKKEVTHAPKKVHTGRYQIGKLLWSTELLDGGKTKTQENWFSWCEQNNFRLPTQKEYVAAVRVLLKEPPSDFKNHFFQDLKEHWLMTSETLPCLDGVERALVLGVGISGWFGISAYVDICYGPARGVAVTKKNFRNQKRTVRI